MGWADLRDFIAMPGVVCKALVDIDQHELERRQKDLLDMGLKSPDLYSDYRKMLENTNTTHPGKMPLALQDHGNPVSFRNIWIREL